LSPNKVNTQKQRQQVIAHYDATIQCLFEGRYQKSLQHAQQAAILMDSMNDSDWTERRILFKLASARANLLDKKFDEAEHILEEKILQRPSADVARCLIGAQIALERKQPEKALEHLDYLEKHQGLHRQAYQLQLRALQRVGNWKKVHETVQAMLKRDFIEPIAASHLERLALAHQIRDCEPHPKALHQLWNHLSDEQQQHPELLREWLERSRDIEDGESLIWLFKGIDHALKYQWNDALWSAYAFHPAQPAQRALLHGEASLERYRDNTHLLRDLGILCTQLELWGKAQSYLEAARSIQPEKETMRALFGLYKAENNEEAAHNLIQELIMQEMNQSIPSSLLHKHKPE
jgi:HemY protein